MMALTENCYDLQILTKLLLITVLLFHATLAQKPIVKGNRFMDKLIQKMKTDRSSVYSLDPLTVPDIKGSYFETNKIVVKGLSNLYRVGSCSLRNSDGASSSVVCKMAADDLLVDFDYWAKALFVWFNGEGTVKIDQLVVELLISFDGQRSTMEKLAVIKLEDFHVQKINGLSVLLNWMLKFIAESVFNRAKDSIKVAVKNTATKALNDIVGENKIET